MPFFENTAYFGEIDVQVLDRWGFTGGRGGRMTPPAHNMQIPKSGKYNGKQHIVVYISCML
jgi:hypothetical protein